jgi:hypothetical protein
LAKRRIERVIALTELNDGMKGAYVEHGTKVFFVFDFVKLISFQLVSWTVNTIEELKQRNFGKTSEEVEVTTLSNAL